MATEGGPRLGAIYTALALSRPVPDVLAEDRYLTSVDVSPHWRVQLPHHDNPLGYTATVFWFARRRDAEAAAKALAKEGVVDTESYRAKGRQECHRICVEALGW